MKGKQTMCMKKASHLGMAAALTAGLIYSVGALALYFVPDQTRMLWAHLYYMESLGSFGSQITLNWKVFLSGLAQMMIYGYLIVYVFVMLAHCMSRYCGVPCGCCGPCGPKGACGPSPKK
jgi:hypothetical protein